MGKLSKLRRSALVVLFVVSVFALVIALAGCSSSGCSSEGSDSCSHTNTTTATTEATCTEEGLVTVTCNDCGEVVSTTPIAALGHDYHTDSAQSVTATCTTEGKTVEVCSRCGDVKETTIARTSHEYEETVTAATCTEQGYTTYVCKYCDDSYVGNYTEAAGHTWTGNTCVGQTCSVCNAEIPATTSHNYETTATASCDEDVEATYTCSICGDTHTQTLLATGHTYATDESGNVVWTLKSDSVLKEGTTCTYVTTYSATCTTCGKEVESTTETDIHTYVLKVTKEATCADAGTKEMVCKYCNAVQADTAVTYYAEHTYDGGTVSGDTTVYTCTTCSKTKTTYSGNTAAVSTETLASDIELGSGTVISMSSDAVSGLSSSDSLSLAADTLTDDDLNNAGLSADELERVGENDVYNITLSNGTENITTFSGTVTVKLPYRLSEGEDETNITIFYLGADGLEVITNAVYTDGYVVFETSHFSYYTIGKYTPAELCAKYGHNTKVLSKEATCLESGYYIEICTRCNETIKSETYAALGHDFASNVTKETTCTENGTVVYTCSHCGTTYSGILVATGHSWVLDSAESVASTCTAAGHNDYYCENCGATYTVTLAQLSHKYTGVVTAPTCTEQGYTTYTCSLCGNSYVGDYVAANGHTWDSDAACADKTCLICGATQAATAEHSYGADGVCTVCGHGCDHTYVQTVIAPTCTEDGYTINVCSKCGNTTITDYVSATGHVYTTDPTKCDVCGAVSGDLTLIFNAIIENCYSYNYTLTLSDVTLMMETDYVSDGNNDTEGYTLEAAELYISYVDGKILIYGNGAITYTYNYTYSDGSASGNSSSPAATVYGDGEYLYICSTVYYATDSTDAYSGSSVVNEETNIQRVSYKNAFGDLYDIIYADAETVAAYNEILEDELVQQWLVVMEDNGSLANQIAAQAFFALFSSTSTGSGYEYTLNLDMLAELNENLYTLTISEFIDEYLGEGTYSAIGDYIASIENKTLYAVVTDILLYGEDYGITSDLVYTTVNTLVALYSGEEGFDIESLLKDDSAESKVIGEMTIAELLAEYAGLSDYSEITAMLEEYGKLNVYKDLLDPELLAGHSEEIYTAIANLTSGDVVSVVFTTDSSYATTSVKIVIDDAVYTQAVYYGTHDEYGNYYETEEVSYIVKLSASGTLNVLYSCTMPEDCDSYKTQIESAYAQIVAAVKAACEENGGTYWLDNYRMFSVNDDGTVSYIYSGYVDDEGLYQAIEYNIESYVDEYLQQMVEDGEISDEDLEDNYDMWYWMYYGMLYWELYDALYSEYTFSLVINDITTADNFYYETDCADSYYVYMYWNSDEYSISAWFYVDIAENEVSTGSFHNYQLDNSVAPAGVPTSADEVGCEEIYYTYYVCADCGAIKYTATWKSHDYDYRYTLVNEGGSCEDGVLHEEYCPVCGEVLWSYTVYYHVYTEEEVLGTLTCNSYTNNGTITVYINSCVCGEEYYIWYDNDGYGCEANSGVLYEYVYGEDGTTVIGEVYKYQCKYTGCQNYYTYTYYYCSATFGPDEYVYYQYDTETGTWSVAFSYTENNSNHYTEYKYDRVYDDDGSYVNQWGYYCQFCSYGYTYTDKYDASGNHIYNGYERTDSNGNVTRSWYYEYTWDSDGNIISASYYNNGEFMYSYTTSSSYDSSTGMHTESTEYTYADGTIRSETEKYLNDSYGRCIYYYYEEAEDGEIIHYDTYSYEFADGETCYALYSYENYWNYGDGYVYTSGDSYYTYYHLTGSYFDNYQGSCTQSYTWGHYCTICGEIAREYTTTPRHDWQYDSELGLYVCWRCGLESENGDSSDIGLEDLTLNSYYGKDGYVSVGYYYEYDSDDMIISYYLVPADSQTNLDLTDEDYIDLDGLISVEDTGSIIYISLDQLKAIAAEKGISLSDYDLRISFWYYYGSDVSSITITDLLVESVAGNTYAFSGAVCVDGNGNDETLIATALENIEEKYKELWFDYISTIEFLDDGTAVVYLNVGEYTYDCTGCEYTQSGSSIKLFYLIFGNYCYITVSEDGGSLSMTAIESKTNYITLDLNNFTSETLENPEITISYSYALVTE